MSTAERLEITVPSEDSRYPIVIQAGILSALSSCLHLGRKVLLVTDDGVPAEYAETVAGQCKYPYIVRIPAGEASKSMEWVSRLLSALLQNGFTRQDCIIAVGGGVVGDLAGFCASCYMRGIDFYNLPTTLLSQVDSSVGGKTAVDFMGVKNIVGAFYPPRAVVIDPATLDTLPDRQLYAGLAEVIKMALISDGALFSRLEQCHSVRNNLPVLIRDAIGIKKAVVEKDPKETGYRRILNFGHTIGHAVEAASGGRFLHGEAVALGMLPFSAPAVRERLLPLLSRFALPTVLPPDFDDTSLAALIAHDKKNTGEAITVVTSEAVGCCTLIKETPDEILARLECIR